MTARAPCLWAAHINSGLLAQATVEMCVQFNDAGSVSCMLMKPNTSPDLRIGLPCIRLQSVESEQGHVVLTAERGSAFEICWC